MRGRRLVARMSFRVLGYAVGRVLGYAAGGVLLFAVGAVAAGSAGALAWPERLPQGERAALEQVVKSASISTRMELPAFPARPEIFEYLLEHPEFASHVTRALRAARLRLWANGDRLELDDGWGARGQLRLVHAEPGRRLYHVRGRAVQALLPDIYGQSVVEYTYAFRRPGAATGGSPGGPAEASTTVAAYVALDSKLLARASAIIGPLAQAKADKEAMRLLKVFGRVSRAIVEHPDEVLARLREAQGIPAAELAEFRRLLQPS